MLSDLSDEALAEIATTELPYRTAAFDELVSRYYEPVRRLAAAQLGPGEDAEALAQDVMLRVFGAIKQFRGEARFSTWLYRIAENLARTRIGQQVRERAKRRAYGQTLSEAVQDDGEDDFQRLLTSLSPEERTLLAFRFVQDLELHEIAEIMGLGLSAVKMRYYRTLEKLKKDRLLEGEP